MLCVCRWKKLRLPSNRQDGGLLTWSHSRNMATVKKKEAWFSRFREKVHSEMGTLEI